MSRYLVVLALFCCFPGAASAAQYRVTPADDLRAAIAALAPGDELVLAGGEYAFGSRFFIVVQGEAERPIVIRGADGERAVISMSTDLQNVMEVIDSRHLALRNLVFTRGSHGIRLINSDFVTIEDCEIFETGDVAISANSGGVYEGLVIRHNHIHHTNGTGEGMYLGCNNNDCRVVDSLIEGNYIHHTNRASVSQGDGIELKEGSAGNTIRHNVIHDTNFPGIITYGTVGMGPPNVIEGNLIWNTNDNGIQSAADSVIRNNIVIGSPITLQPHQAASPSNQSVVHNTVIGSGINVRGVVGPVVIANNAVYNTVGFAIRLIDGATHLVSLAGNVGLGGFAGAASGYVEGRGVEADFVDGHFKGAPPIDLFPAPDSPLIGAGAPGHVVEFDFNGELRNGIADVGAYRFKPGGNTGWTLSAGFKSHLDTPLRVPMPPTDVKLR